MSRRGSLIQLCVIKEQKGVRDISSTDTDCGRLGSKWNLSAGKQAF